MNNRDGGGQFKCPHCLEEPRFERFVNLHMHLWYEHGLRSMRRDKIFNYLVFELEDFLDALFIDVHND